MSIFAPFLAIAGLVLILTGAGMRSVFVAVAGLLSLFVVAPALLILG